MDSRKLYHVNLTEEEREQLLALTSKGKAGAREIKRAHILLLADKEQSDRKISEALNVSIPTIERTRRRFVEEGLARALTELPRSGRPAKLDGRQEAHLIAIACSSPPEGRVKWTMQLLADKFVELGHVEKLSDETVRCILKKFISSLGRTKHGVLAR